MVFYLIFTLTHLVFGFLIIYIYIYIYIYFSLALCNCFIIYRVKPFLAFLLLIYILLKIFVSQLEYGVVEG